jgi:hypothetical protein
MTTSSVVALPTLHWPWIEKLFTTIATVYSGLPPSCGATSFLLIVRAISQIAISITSVKTRPRHTTLTKPIPPSPTLKLLPYHHQHHRHHVNAARRLVQHHHPLLTTLTLPLKLPTVQHLLHLPHQHQHHHQRLPSLRRNVPRTSHPHLTTPSYQHLRQPLQLHITASSLRLDLLTCFKTIVLTSSTRLSLWVATFTNRSGIATTSHTHIHPAVRLLF